MKLFVKYLATLPFELWLRRKRVAIPVPIQGIRHILVMRYDAIGDMIVTLPMLEEIHRLAPAATIDVVTSPANKGLLADHPLIRTVFLHNKTLSSLLRLPAQKRGSSYDVVFSVVVHRTSHAGIVAGVIAGRNTMVAAFGHAERTELYNTWFNIQVPVERNKETMAEMQVRLVRKVFGATTDAPAPPIKLHFSNTTYAAAQHAMPTLSGKIIALNISAGAEYRCWTVERNEELIKKILNAFPEVSILIFSDTSRASDAEQLVATVQERVAHYPVQKDIRVVFAALRFVDMIITPDTSFVHAASGMQVPVVGYFSHITNYLKEWMPYGVPYKAVFTQGAVPVNTISAQEVFEAFSELYAEIGESVQ